MFLFLHVDSDRKALMRVTSLFQQGEDAGNYMCVATNDAGVVERSVTLTLQSKTLFYWVNSLLCEMTSAGAQLLVRHKNLPTSLSKKYT